MLACARLGAVHSVVFGGFAADELAVRIDDAQPEGRRRRVLRRSSRPGSWSTSRCSTGRWSSPSTSRTPASCKQRPQAEADARSTDRDVDWDVAMKAGAADPAELRRGRGDRPALRPLHVRHDRQAQGHRPRQRRPRGGAGLVAAERLRHPPGPGLVDRLRRRLGRRPLLHRLRAADRRRDDGALRGQAGRHPGRRRVLAGDRRARGRGAVHRADRDPGDQEGGPGGRAAAPATTCLACARSSSPASGSTPTPTTGRPSSLGVPVVDNWWQTETGLADRRQPARPRADADQARLADACRCPGYDVQVLDESGEPVRAGGGGRDLHPAAAAAGHAADAVGRRRPVRRRRTCRRSTATTCPATVATSTRTATST